MFSQYCLIVHYWLAIVIYYDLMSMILLMDSVLHFVVGNITIFGTVLNYSLTLASIYIFNRYLFQVCIYAVRLA